jgi:hypothetical protein
MEINESPVLVEIDYKDKKYFFNKPSYKGYDYVNLSKKMVELDIDQIRIGIKTCNIVSNTKILMKLKKLFGYKNVSFTGSYKDKIYQYNIKFMNDKEFDSFKKINQL